MDAPQQLIATTGLHVPHRRIRAYGFTPVALTPRATAQRAGSEGVCAAAHGWAASLLSDESRFAAAVLTTRCDQLRRTAEALQARTRLPLFLLNIPATHGTEAARRLYEEELQRLDRFLDRLGEGPQGEPVPCLGGTGDASATDATAGTCQGYEIRRETHSGRAVSPHTATDAGGEASLPDRALRLAPDAAEAAGSERSGGPRVGVLACCLTDADLAVIHLLRQVGLRIAVNATECPLDDTGKHLAASLQTGEPPPSVAQRPNTPFFAWLCQASGAERLQGWVLVRQPCCDLYRAEVLRMKSETGLPWLDLETGASPAFEALRTRAEAFVELLRAAAGGVYRPGEGTRA